MESHNVWLVTMVPSAAAKNSGSSPNSMDFNTLPLALYIHRLMERQRKGCRLKKKRLLKKATDSENDPDLGLLSYRAARLECGASPAELLMNPKLCATLPHISKKNNKWMNKKKMTLKVKQKTSYNTTARRLEPLQERDVMKIEDPNSWNRRATVLKEVSPSSFTVKTEDGQVIRRLRRTLRNVLR